MKPRRRVRFSLSGTMGWELAPLLQKIRLAERLGFDGFYASDHLLGVAGVPRDVAFMEPWTLLAAFAPQTRALRLGVLVSGVTYRHPSMLAKIAATLDVLSGGRVDLGLGAGWSREDHVAYGLEFPALRERLERLEEAVELICALWTQPRADFRGRYYQLRDAPFAPRPVQPQPPILLAGASPRLLRLAARRATQWVSVSTARFAGACVRAIEAECRVQGRDPAELEFAQSTGLLVSDSRDEVARVLAARAQAARSRAGASARETGGPFGSGTPDSAQARTALPDETPEERARGSILAGDPAGVREEIARYVDAGVTHFILQTPAPLDVRALERFRHEVAPAFV